MHCIRGRNIAVDMDEVLFPMISRLDRYYKRKYKKSPPIHYPKKYDYSTYFNISVNESKEFVNSFYYSDIAYSTKPINNSVNAMRKLKNNNNRLSVVTGRQTYPQCKNVTSYLLQTHFGNLFDKVIFTNSYSLHGTETAKSDICKLHNFDLLIDDSVYNCKESLENNIESILYGEYEWNKDCHDLTRIPSWEKFM